MTPKAQTRKDKTNAGGVDTLQHRHLAAIAGIISKISPGERADIARHFADEIAAGNTRFDRDRFLRACLSVGPPCPSCGAHLRSVPAQNALSRYRNVYICSDCGTREALGGDFWAPNGKLPAAAKKLVAMQAEWRAK